jgi:hypothetical protein
MRRAAVSLASVSMLLGPANNRSAVYGILLIAAVLGLAWLFTTSLWLALRAEGLCPGQSGLRQYGPVN